MACLTPIPVRPKKGTFSPDGFSLIPAPCGKCRNCRKTRANDWAFRMDQEMKLHQCAYMFTLTYDIAPQAPSGLLTLSRNRNYIDLVTGKVKRESGDLTKFFKRLRKNTGRKNIKYYACGEYGGTFNRPHYHCIIYDVEFEDVELAWSVDGCSLGYIDVKPFTDGTTRYAVSYNSKPKRVPMFEGDDRVKEFSCMSRGLGKNYLTEAMVKWHQDGQRSFLVLPGGINAHLPRYYRDRLFTDAEREEMNAKSQSGKAAQLLANMREYGYSDSLPDDHCVNQEAYNSYRRACDEAIRSANLQYFKKNKRNKYD